MLNRKSQTANRKFLALLFAATMALSCSRPALDPAFRPHENLLTILADFERFSTLDLYRFRAPLDPSGVSVFRATLVRLANYERLYPDRFPDVIAYARGQAYERLSDYGAAVEEFGLVIEMDSDLGVEAAESRAVNRRFEALIEPSRSASGLHEYLDALAERRDAFVKLAEQYTYGQGGLALSTRGVYRTLALREVERADVARAEALWRYRELLPDGPSGALDAWEAALTEHKESARVEQVRLRVGDCYYEMAREYTQEHDPEGADFDAEVFERMTRAAIVHYRTTSRAYGHLERVEAKAKLDAVNAFINRINARAQ